MASSSCNTSHNTMIEGRTLIKDLFQNYCNYSRVGNTTFTGEWSPYLTISINCNYNWNRCLDEKLNGTFRVDEKAFWAKFIGQITFEQMDNVSIRYLDDIDNFQEILAEQSVTLEEREKVQVWVHKQIQMLMKRQEYVEKEYEQYLFINFPIERQLPEVEKIPKFGIVKEIHKSGFVIHKHITTYEQELERRADREKANAGDKEAARGLRIIRALQTGNKNHLYPGDIEEDEPVLVRCTPEELNEHRKTGKFPDQQKDVEGNNPDQNINEVVIEPQTTIEDDAGERTPEVNADLGQGGNANETTEIAEVLPTDEPDIGMSRIDKEDVRIVRLEPSNQKKGQKDTPNSSMVEVTKQGAVNPLLGLDDDSKDSTSSGFIQDKINSDMDEDSRDEMDKLRVADGLLNSDESSRDSTITNESEPIRYGDSDSDEGF